VNPLVPVVRLYLLKLIEDNSALIQAQYLTSLTKFRPV